MAVLEMNPRRVVLANAPGPGEGQRGHASLDLDVLHLGPAGIVEQRNDDVRAMAKRTRTRALQAVNRPIGHLAPGSGRAVIALMLRVCLGRDQMGETP